jgi:hypothetical protein
MMRKALFASLAVLAVAACDRPAKTEETIETVPSVGQEALGPAAGAVDAVTTPPAAPPPGEQGGTDLWPTVASAEDEDRIARLPDAWRTALREAGADHGAMVDTQGMLLVPDAALAGNLQPPPGTYRCKTLKLGSQMQPAGLAFVEYPPFKCTIELSPGGDLILTKTTGSQRLRGLLYPDSDKRLVFIGAQAWGADEKGYPTYGQMPERDQIGVFERVGTDRWRLTLPWPKQESKLDVLELRK